MLAGMRPFVGPHELKSLLGNGPHRLDVLLKAQIEHRPHMQTADGRVRIPGAAGSVLLENIGQPLVYSARCSSGTAQSSRRRPVFPASFMDIMMLRPAVRISLMAVCSFGSSTSMTPPHSALGLSQRKPRSADQFVEPQ